MKVLGITAEYNPLHNGHIYHLERSREMTDADCCVVVMSGDFTQRGEAAVADKWVRSRLAVKHGADLVLELPFVFACARGEMFASGAVDILEGIGATDISFGSENGRIEALTELVRLLEAHGDDIGEERRTIMAGGSSYASAYRTAVSSVLGEEMAELLDGPNNILAIEYLRRIEYWKKRGREIKAHTVARYGSGYRDANEESGFAGASAIRRMMAEGRTDVLGHFVPEDVASQLTRAEDPQMTDKREFLLLRSQLVRSSSEELSRIYCMGEGLENKLKKEIVRSGSLEELLAAVVSRRYTESAVRRLLIYVLLGLACYEPPRQIYGRVLAAGPRGRELLRSVTNDVERDMPVITNINKEQEMCAAVTDTLRYDVLAADMYNILKGRDLYAFSDKVVRPYMG